MIISFHPMIEGDRWILCAGRNPDEQDLAAIRGADAVILPQGCRRTLWEMAVENCPNVFPEYRLRFQYPGKTDQIRLFEQSGVRYPETLLYNNVESFAAATSSLRFAYPFVFKLDWGGEGDTVYLVESPPDLRRALLRARQAERSGAAGFLVQRFIDCGGRTLRVAVIGQRRVSYWRQANGTNGFHANLIRGGSIDFTSDPRVMQSGVRAVECFCGKYRIDLAAFDLLFDRNDTHGETPLFLEINYFFGRAGLGGSSMYYRVLFSEINNWLTSIGLPPLPEQAFE